MMYLYGDIHKKVALFYVHQLCSTGSQEFVHHQKDLWKILMSLFLQCNPKLVTIVASSAQTWDQWREFTTQWYHGRALPCLPKLQAFFRIELKVYSVERINYKCHPRYPKNVFRSTETSIFSLCKSHYDSCSRGHISSSGYTPYHKSSWKLFLYQRIHFDFWTPESEIMRGNILTFVHWTAIVVCVIVTFKTYRFIYADKRGIINHHLPEIWQDKYCNRPTINAVGSSFQHYLFLPDVVSSDFGSISSTVICLAVAFIRILFAVHAYPHRWGLVNPTSRIAGKQEQINLGETN